MDLVPLKNHTRVLQQYQEKVAPFTENCVLHILGTSIWNESLFRAWSSICENLVPSIESIKTKLAKFIQICESDEIILFERQTFLVISRLTRPGAQFRDNKRFEKISNIIKQFKLSCARSQCDFNSVEINPKGFTAFLQSFTATTYILVIMSAPDIERATTTINIRSARKYFTKVLDKLPSSLGSQSTSTVVSTNLSTDTTPDEPLSDDEDMF